MAIRTLSAAALAASMLLATSAAHAVTVIYGNWQITKSNGILSVVDPSGVTVGASGGNVTSNFAEFDGADIFGVPNRGGTNNSQTLTFDLVSNGFFSQEPGAHIAVLVSGSWEKSTPGTSNGYAAGRGLAIGSVYGGCPAGTAVIESAWIGGNYIFGPTSSSYNTCSAILVDNRTYHFTVTFNTGGIPGSGGTPSITYKIVDATNNATVGNFTVPDVASNTTSRYTGGWMIATAGANYVNKTWTLSFNNVQLLGN